MNDHVPNATAADRLKQLGSVGVGRGCGGATQGICVKDAFDMTAGHPTVVALARLAFVYSRHQE